MYIYMYYNHPPRRGACAWIYLVFQIHPRNFNNHRHLSIRVFAQFIDPRKKIPNLRRFWHHKLGGSRRRRHLQSTLTIIL